MEITRNIRISRGELTLLTRLIFLCDCDTIITTSSGSHSKTADHETRTQWKAREIRWIQIGVMVLTCHEHSKRQTPLPFKSFSHVPSLAVHMLTRIIVFFEVHMETTLVLLLVSEQS